MLWPEPLGSWLGSDGFSVPWCSRNDCYYLEPSAELPEEAPPSAGYEARPKGRSSSTGVRLARLVAVFVADKWWEALHRGVQARKAPSLWGNYCNGWVDACVLAGKCWSITVSSDTQPIRS